MYIHSVRLCNYKSFGDYPENEVILEPKVTAIIGKNESGKSNVISGLGQIDFRKKRNRSYFEPIVNRTCGEISELRYIITLKSTDFDLAIGIDGDSSIEIGYDFYNIEGALRQYYDAVILGNIIAVAEHLDKLGGNPFKLSQHDAEQYRNHKNQIADTTIANIPQKIIALTYIKQKENALQLEDRRKLSSLIAEANTSINQFLSLLPKFFVRHNDKHLNTTYKLEEVQNELKPGSNSLLLDFLIAIGIEPEDFLLAVQNGTTAKQSSIRGKIRRHVTENINEKFKQFYKTEPISLSLDFNNNAVTFVVQSSDGEELQYSERSNGLRWYLETFIEVQANDLPYQNVVYLFDEPGSSLHVNAQRELLKLFHDLAKSGNQVIYATHSPYMLDTENDGIHRIRAVVKNQEGFSYVYKNAYDAQIAPDSRRDTLAPVVSALGMNLQDTFGPAKDKLNIVTEGMSDYIYLCTMAKKLGIDENKYVILPSVGVTNSVNICAILHGWGCKFIALFDFDKEGVESGGEILRNKMLLELGKHYCFTKEIQQEEIDSKKYNADKHMIEDVILRSEIKRFCDETGTPDTLGKTLLAKLLCNAVEGGTFELVPQSIENFKNLFNRLMNIQA